MKIDNFIEILVEELELEQDDINFETNIKELDEWDSLTALMLIGFVNNKFEVSLTNQDLEKITNIKSLINIIGKDKFN
jgi:acyl carrier protein